MGPELFAAAGSDIVTALEAGALSIGEETGLPVHCYPLERTVDAHRAVEGDAVGKGLIDVTDESR